ncbi:MAG: glycoside hydrolase family 30 beta sandwich domain-containing protein [Acutalibacteraceae bacterium]|nr:glycoside hydrolase family 30 beta sandwich domain-containing protein [Acutalibacteraceae bacterium]
MLWISSTENEKWSENNHLTEEKGSELTIGREQGKALFGWGCCISEICAKAIFSLNKEAQQEIFDELFSKEECGFDYCRLSIGANDFAESWYSYNETDGDYGMENFSIDRDRKYIIPAIKEAQKRSSDIRFFASPWSPPTWMKYPKVYNFGRLVTTPENLKAYALYFRKFIEEYEKENIVISAVCPQNEFFSNQKFPSCVYSAKELENFMCYLVDEIKDMTDIYYGTCNGPDGYGEEGTHNVFLNYLMQNPKLRQNVKGAAFQWNGKYSVMQANEDFPELDIIQSECQCGDGKNTWDYAMFTYSLIHHYFLNGVRANVYWNMALESDSMSSWGWKQNSLISVKDGNYTFNPEFYLLKHFANLIKRGAVMLSTVGEMSSNSTVFKNTDGSIVAVILNPFEFEKIVTIESKNYRLKPRSFNTIKIK